MGSSPFESITISPMVGYGVGYASLGLRREAIWLTEENDS